jgi:hypothetical protein
MKKLPVFYGTVASITVYTKPRHWPLSWLTVSWMQLTLSHTPCHTSSHLPLRFPSRRFSSHFMKNSLIYHLSNAFFVFHSWCLFDLINVMTSVAVGCILLQCGVSHETTRQCTRKKSVSLTAYSFFFVPVPVCAFTASGVPSGTLVSVNSFSTLCWWLVQRQGWRVKGWMWPSEQAISAEANSWLDYQRPLEN